MADVNMDLAAKLVNHFMLMLDRRNIQNRRKSRIPFDTLLQVSQAGSSEAVSQDPEAKTEELLQHIRQSEVTFILPGVIHCLLFTMAFSYQ